MADRHRETGSPATSPTAEQPPDEKKEETKTDVVTDSIKAAREALDEAEKWHAKGDSAKVTVDFLQMGKRRLQDGINSLK